MTEEKNDEIIHLHHPLFPDYYAAIGLKVEKILSDSKLTLCDKVAMLETMKFKLMIETYTEFQINQKVME